MTEIGEYVNVEYTCRACLKSCDDVYTMTPEDMIYFSTLIKVECLELHNYLCVICSWIFKKCVKFTQSCLLANQALVDGCSQLSSITLPYHHNYVAKQLETISIEDNGNTQITSIVDNDIVKANTNDNKQEDVEEPDYGSDQDNAFEPIHAVDDLKKENHDDAVDDLQKDGGFEDDCSEFKLENDVTKPKRRRSGRKLKALSLEFNLKSRNPYKSDRAANAKCKGDQKSKIKPKAQDNRDGFTSRMLKETDEFLVIKLTKEQVLDELRERSNNEVYQRARYKCESCVKSFNFEDVMQAHMDKHTLKRGSLQCDICYMYCPSAQSLRGHMKSHTTRYKCKVCGVTRLSRQHLLEHFAIAHSGNARVYNCQFCSFTSQRRTVIQRHVKSHSSEEQHPCEKCGKLFSTLERLRVHTTRHDSDKYFSCHSCQSRFIFASALRRHENEVHARADHYCVECDVKFKSTCGLKKHLENSKKHRATTEAKYTCQHCQKTFPTKSSLSNHVWVHGSNEYKCGQCGRAFSTREYVRSHVKRVHNKQYVCDTCKSSFTRKTALRYHIGTHSSDMQFQCYTPKAIC